MIQMLMSRMGGSKKKTESYPSINSSLDGRLKIVEQQLHLVIQNCSALSGENNNNNNVDSGSRESMLSCKSINSIDTVDALKLDPTSFTLNSLRLRMRLVRRWRNGSRLCSIGEINELSSFLTIARLKTVTLQLEQLRKELDDLDSVVIHTGADDVARTLRLQLECDVNALSDALESIHDEEEEASDSNLCSLEGQMKIMNETFKTL